jgi:hypothetical protein
MPRSRIVLRGQRVARAEADKRFDRRAQLRFGNVGVRLGLGGDRSRDETRQ